MNALAFFFTKRFNRFDTIVLVTVAVFVGRQELGLLWGVLVLVLGLIVSGAGEVLLAERAEGKRS